MDTVTITFNGVEMEVEGEYYKGCRGVMYTRNGDGYPDEPPEFDIHSIKIGDVDIGEMFDGLYVRRVPALGGKEYYVEAWQEIEDLCIDQMRDDDGRYDE